MEKSDINHSPAFREFIQKRCDEIIENDERCISLNGKILKLEQELYPLLSEETLGMVLKIDELTLELIDHIYTLSTPIILR
jgi:hypothetical protein